jgi:hypothetical protein
MSRFVLPLILLLLGYSSTCKEAAAAAAFLTSPASLSSTRNPTPHQHPPQPWIRPTTTTITTPAATPSRSAIVAWSSTSPTSGSRTSTSTTTTDTKPLYDGTNYTFPDTTTPLGIAELLEVSFVHACLQLRTGHVDVLKLFVASAIAGYEFGFSVVPQLSEALDSCSTTQNTAGRPLSNEEVDLRQIWISLVYLILLAIDHPMKQQQQQQQDTASAVLLLESIPQTIRSDYGAIVQQLAEAYCGGDDNEEPVVLSLAELVARDDPLHTLDPMQRAIRSQCLRVLSLTLQVLQESAEAAVEGSSSKSQQQPPTPPIPGAF